MKLRTRFLSAAFDWRITDDLLLQVNVTDRDYKKLGNPSSWSFAPGAVRPSAKEIDNTRIWGQHWERNHYQNTRYGANLRWEAAPWLTLRAGWMQSDSERGYADGVSNTFQADGSFTRSGRFFGPGVDTMNQISKDTRAQLFGDFRFETGTISHQVTAGVQYHKDWSVRYSNGWAPYVTVFSDGHLEDGPRYVDRPVVAPFDRGARNATWTDTRTTFTVGDDIRLDERWSLLAGLSHSTIEVRSQGWSTPPYEESAVTPTLSLIYKPLPAVTTYVTYMESLEQGGTAAEQFGGAPVVNAGESMKPMVSDQIEIGAKWSVGGMLLSTALFQIDKSLQYYDISDPAAPVYVQDGRQVHRGIEFTAFGRMAERWSLIGGLTLLDAKVKKQEQNPALEGKHPTGTAERLAKLRVEYDTRWLPGLTLVGGVQYTRHRYADQMNTDRLPAFTLFDVGARYATTLAGRPLTARLEVQNAGDRRYWNNGSEVGEPRTLTFSLSTDF